MTHDSSFKHIDILGDTGNRGLGIKMFLMVWFMIGSENYVSNYKGNNNRVNKSIWWSIMPYSSNVFVDCVIPRNDAYDTM